MMGDGSSKEKASHRDLFRDIRAKDGDVRLLRLFSGFKHNFVPLAAAATEMGVTPEAMLEAGYRLQLFFIFARPSMVQVVPATADLAKYGQPPFSTPEFFVLPTDACFSLIFRQETEVAFVERALRFLDSRGLSVAEWPMPIVSAQSTAGGDAPISIDRGSSKNWALWAFLREGRLTGVSIGRKDLYVLREELTLTAPLLREAASREQETYKSDRLELLREAARFFWGNASVDPRLPETFPRTQDIEQWFLERGIPRSLIEHAARLIRPNYAPKGRPRASTREK